MIRFLNVSRHFAQDGGVEGITFTLQRGDFALLVGHTGAGKTTILRLLYFDLLPESGQIMIAGQFLPGNRPRHIALMRRKIGIVFPEPRLLADRNIFDNVALPLRIAGENRRRIQRQVSRLLCRFGLQNLARAFPPEISSGEQKKAAIARALATRPFILLADEPLSNIDRDSGAEILEHLQRINAEGTTILAATHMAQPYEGIARRILQLQDGKLVA